MKETKLAFLINSLNGGGAETLTIAMSRAFGKSPLIILEDIVDYETDDLPIIKLNEGVVDRSVGRYIQLPGLAKKLSTVANKDHLIVVSLFRAFLVAWLSKQVFNGGEFICWVHNDTTHYSGNKLVAWLYHRVFSSAKAIVVNSAKAKKDLVTHGLAQEARTEVIYNFFDPEAIRARAIQPLPQGIDLPDEPFFVVMGRLHRMKGHRFLFEVMASMSSSMPSLVVIGDGEENAALREFVHDHGLQGKVTFVGFQDNPYPIITRAEALISCSETEGFGNVLVEGIICGVPVISTDIDSGPREILAPDSPDLTKRTLVREMAKYGVLMPRSNAPDAKSVKSIWADTLYRATTDDSFLAPYRQLPDEAFAPFTQNYILGKWRNLLTLNNKV